MTRASLSSAPRLETYKSGSSSGSRVRRCASRLESCDEALWRRNAAATELQGPDAEESTFYLFSKLQL